MTISLEKTYAPAAAEAYAPDTVAAEDAAAYPISMEAVAAVGEALREVTDALAQLADDELRADIKARLEALLAAGSLTAASLGEVQQLAEDAAEALTIQRLEGVFDLQQSYADQLRAAFTPRESLTAAWDNFVGRSAEDAADYFEDYAPGANYYFYPGEIEEALEAFGREVETYAFEIIGETAPGRYVFRACPYQISYSDNAFGLREVGRYEFAETLEDLIADAIDATAWREESEPEELAAEVLDLMADGDTKLGALLAPMIAKAARDYCSEG